MLKDITLGQFFPGDTLAHKLDPRTKLLVTVFYVVALFTAKSYIAYRARGTTVVLVSHSMEEIARNVDRIVVLSDGKVYMEGAPKQVFARAHELEQVGLDVPQVTKVAAALKARGLDIDTAVYTVEALEQKLLTLRGGAGGC